MSQAERPAAHHPVAAGPAGTFGDPDPTLLQLAREGKRWAWVGIVVIIVGLVIGLLSVTIFRPGAPKGGGATVSVKADPGFKLGYARGELRVASANAKEVELTDRKAGDPQGSRLFVTPMPLAAYSGSPSGALPLTSERAKRQITARFDAGSVRFVDEGLINIGPNPGYQLSYTAKRDGNTWYGRAAVVVPDIDGERGAVLMDGEEQRTTNGQIVSPRAVGRTGDLRLPMRSLVFTGN